MIRGIHHVAVHVRDLDRMIKFYKDAFGFELVGEPFAWEKSEFIDRIVDVPDSAAKGAMLRCGTCYMELFEYQQPKPASAEPKQPYDKGYTHFCVDVTDIEQEFTRLRDLARRSGTPSSSAMTSRPKRRRSITRTSNGDRSTRGVNGDRDRRESRGRGGARRRGARCADSRAYQHRFGSPHPVHPRRARQAAAQPRAWLWRDVREQDRQAEQVEPVHAEQVGEHQQRRAVVPHKVQHLRAVAVGREDVDLVDHDQTAQLAITRELHHPLRHGLHAVDGADRVGAVLEAVVGQQVAGDVAVLRHRGRVARLGPNAPAVFTVLSFARDAFTTVLADHLVEGSKETALTQGLGPYVMVTGHPYVDVWQAVKPAVVGIPAWPAVPRGEDWKTGVCARLGVDPTRSGSGGATWPVA